MIFGCGYAGGAVARAALARGWRVCALTRNAQRVAELRAAGIDAIQATLSSPDWHPRLPREARFVLNSVSSAGGGLPGYRESYVEGTKSIVGWAGEGSPATFVYTGSTSVYGTADGSVVDEDAPVDGSEASGPLLEAERMVFGAGCFARAFVLRLAGIYGPGRHFLLDQLMGGAELLPGTGTHRLNLVHRDDIVSAVFACFDAKQVSGGLFNVCGDSASPKADLVDWLCARLGRKPPVFAHDAGLRGPTPGLVRGRSGPVPDRVISNARIGRVLGWRPAYPDFRSGYEQIFQAEGITGGP